MSKKDKDQAPGDAAAEIQKQTDEQQREDAGNTLLAKEDAAQDGKFNDPPANVIEKGTTEFDPNAPQQEGAIAGDLNAGEGNTLNVTKQPDGTADTASSLTQKGPEQPHITEDLAREAERTEGAIDIGVTDGQDVEAVQERADAEIGDLAADLQDPSGILRTGDGVPAYAEPGSYAAAVQGVQQDASGHFESVAHTRSTKSGTRV